MNNKILLCAIHGLIRYIYEKDNNVILKSYT